jgi:hypothetical protein
MAGIIVGNGTAASAEATVDTNGDLHVRTPLTESKAGFVTLSAEIDAGAATGSRYQRALEATADYRLRVGMDQPMFNLSFEGTIIPRDRLQQNDTTMTCAQASGFLTLNSGASVTTAQNTNVKTYRTFPVFGTYPTYVEIWAKPVNETATNSTTEFGVGYASAATAATDGCFFRYNAGGALYAVVSYGGSETPVLIASPPTTNQTHHWMIAIHHEEVEFWINDVLQAEVATPPANPQPMSSNAQPFFARIVNSGAASAARQLSIGMLNVSLGDANATRPWSHAMCGTGGGSYQTQPGVASGPTCTRGAAQTGWPTSATAQTAVAFTTATTSPGINSLGGYMLTAAVSTMTANADYPLYAYLNPAGTATLPGKTLYVTGARVGELVPQAAGGAVTTLIFGLGVGSTSANTTATEGAAIVAARIVPVGATGILAATAVGVAQGGWNLDFSSAPLVVPPGTYLHLIVRPTVITGVTLTWIQTFTVIGYHE